MKKNILMLGFAIAAAGCQSDDNDAVNANNNNTNNEPVAVPFAVIADLYISASEGVPEGNFVIDNAEDWNSLIAQMDAITPISGNFAENDIDFTEYKVIAVIDEMHTQYGYDAVIESIVDNGSQIVVDVEYTSPGPIAGDAMQQPFYIVKIPQTGHPVIFQ